MEEVIGRGVLTITIRWLLSGTGPAEERRVIPERCLVFLVLCSPLSPMLVPPAVNEYPPPESIIRLYHTCVGKRKTVMRSKR